MASAEHIEGQKSFYERGEEVGAEITQLCGCLYAATYRLLVLIRQFDEEKLWGLPGLCSCAHWLNFQCGIGMNAAREKVRVANALPDLPKISDAFSKGEISYSKVRAMTRVANQENEDFLLMIARHGSAHNVESLVSKYRRAVRLQDVELANKQYAERSAHCYFDNDGAFVMNARFPAEQGALIMKALDLAIDQEDVTAETSDAAEATNNYLEHGPHVAAETSRRIACDSSISILHEDQDGQPLSIGRKSRVIPPAMRRALRARDEGCRYSEVCH